MNKASKIVSMIFWILIVIQGVSSFIFTHDPNTLYICFVGAAVITISYEISLVDKASAYLYIATISLVLAAYFGTDYARHKDPIIDGIMLIMSSTTFAVVGLSWFSRNKKDS